MWSKNCRSKGLCPVSFGLALGITAFIATFIWLSWMMFHGVTEMTSPTMTHQVITFTWGTTFGFSFLALIKGFIVGLIFALLYDCFICCCKSRCCKDDGGTCGCGCKCCGVKETDIKTGL